MKNIIDIGELRKNAIKVQELRSLDIKASYIILEQCIKQLKLNTLPELNELKKTIFKTMNNLRKLDKNVRR